MSGTTDANAEQEGHIPGAGDEASESTGDRGPIVQRARIKVNRPAPRTKTFGTGEPAFVKAEGRSPGAPPLAESGRVLGALPPAPDSGRLPELKKKPPSSLAVLLGRLRGVSSLEWAGVAAVIFCVVFLVLVARGR